MLIALALGGLYAKGQAEESGAVAPEAIDSWSERPIKILAPARPGGGLSLTASFFTETTGKTPEMTNNSGMPGYIKIKKIADSMKIR